MALVIYNTLSRKKEVFTPRKQGLVQMFVCGPTVYEDSHIGHARSYVVFDVVARYLRFLGYNVRYIQNLTDIDDKIIDKANKLGISESDVAEQFTRSYFDDMNALKVTSVDQYLAATKYVAHIIDQVHRLIKQKHAYVIADGVYFDISTFLEYGKLSGQNVDELKQHRVEPNPQKKNPGDFSLWKKHKEGEPYWDSPWGKGRPGWHIEDTAITEHEFGPQYDIHGGGIDLIFPHHDCEIAQIEAVSKKKPLVNYWMHNEFLRINGVKMSKSLGNWVTIKDALKKWNAETLRYFFLSTHYRTPLNFTPEALDGANAALERLHFFVRSLEEVTAQKGKYDLDPILTSTREEFDSAMNDDFEVSRALASLFGLVKEVNTHINEISQEQASRIKSELAKYNTVLGVLEVKEEKIPPEITLLVKQRELARNKKDYTTSDALRKKILDKGYTLDDTSKGARVRKAP